MEIITIASIVTAVAVLVPAVFIIAKIRWYGDNRPWKISFSNKSRDEIKDDKDMDNEIILGLGEAYILMRIYTKRPSDFSWVGIRPMRVKYWFWHSNFKENPPLIVGETKYLEKSEGIYAIESCKADNVGGVDIKYAPPVMVSEGFRRHWRVYLKATHEGKGVIQFSSVVKGKRRNVYGKFKISKEK